MKQISLLTSNVFLQSMLSIAGYCIVFLCDIAMCIFGFLSINLNRQDFWLVHLMKQNFYERNIITYIQCVSAITPFHSRRLYCICIVSSTALLCLYM